MDAKEILVMIVEVLIVFSILAIGSITLLSASSNKENKARYEHGKQMGALTARDIGCEKAYKIADNLPESAYRDGYIEGIAMQRNL